MKKLKMLYISDHTICFRLPVSAFATVSRKSFNGKFTAKLIDNRAFHVTTTDADISGSLKFLNTLLDKYLVNML